MVDDRWSVEVTGRWVFRFSPEALDFAGNHSFRLVPAPLGGPAWCGTAGRGSPGDPRAGGLS